MTRELVNVAQLQEFDEIVDVRSPSEYALDHIPGAINCPVLNDEERARVGTVHAQQSAFAAKRIGAALVARNIATHLDTVFADKPKQWAPLIYCWRGGQRSAAITIVLRQTGWDARRLDGGYKSYRRHVIAETGRFAGQLSFEVICGLTGSGKSALLRELDRLGMQVLDLEQIAAHRGSVLGTLPGGTQPPQKLFESRLWERLRQFDPVRPVYVEAESRRIGQLRIPEPLMTAMRGSPCLFLEATPAARVNLLLREYAHLRIETARLSSQLDCLTWLHGRRRIDQWKSLAAQGHWDELIHELLFRHYDPAYRKSAGTNYVQLERAPRLPVHDGSHAEFAQLAQQLASNEPVRDGSADGRAPIVA